MHSPTLVILAAILSALVTAVLFAMWHFNRNIPGLRLWMLSYFFAFVFGVGLLARGQLPEVVSVVFSQASVSLAAYLCLLGARAYMGRPAVSHGYAAVAIGTLVLLAVYFTVVRPHLGMRFVFAGLGAGVFFLLTARTLAHGGIGLVPARYMFAAAAGGHGLFLLLRPLLFTLGDGPVDGPLNATVVAQISQFVVLESLVALLLLAFGTLMLANEFITSELRHLAEVDPLTNVFNRRAFLTLLDKAMSHAQRTAGGGPPVLVIDLDHFKKVNDTWGHQCGDEVLRHFVLLANRCLRREDVLGRLGGEEFAIVLPNAGYEGARTVAERLCAMVAAQPMPTARGPIALTVSIGVTLCTAGDTPDAALQRADEAMYLAKKRGRNRVEVVQAPERAVAAANAVPAL
ncbi:GGDEF domain-containing protein [Acidovorax sp.]|uniref:GGDEF domain-containing protein n=1 Tax=Acidovorax sp. TaxID=1872122 RepID=UPI002ACECBD5|nr:GGDEF domain-containing protein [Acidovorax sp.]MDZ7862703.1 GGDEF domain-containing protein [Acidovorax sp.]